MSEPTSDAIRRVFLRRLLDLAAIDATLYALDAEDALRSFAAIVQADDRDALRAFALQARTLIQARELPVPVAPAAIAAAPELRGAAAPLRIPLPAIVAKFRDRAFQTRAMLFLAIALLFVAIVSRLLAPPTRHDAPLTPSIAASPAPEQSTP